MRGIMSRELTVKQRRFVNQYLVDMNATQAAIRAGYSESTARQQGAYLLSNPNVLEAIMSGAEEQAERTKIDADWVLLRVADMLEADITDIVDDDGSYKPVKQWPKVWRQMLSGMDIKELYEGRGDNRERIGEVVKIRFVDRLKALEILGKHVNVQAFRERIDTNLTLNVEPIDADMPVGEAAKIYVDNIRGRKQVH